MTDEEREDAMRQFALQKAIDLLPFVTQCDSADIIPVAELFRKFLMNEDIG